LKELGLLEYLCYISGYDFKNFIYTLFVYSRVFRDCSLCYF